MSYHNMRISVLCYFLFFIVYLFVIYGTFATPVLYSGNQTLNSSYILIHTLDGELRLVNRRTGLVKWIKLLDPALSVTYDGGPIFIPDPIEGRMYEYSPATSEDLLTHLDHSIMGYVRRSPAYYKHHISFGSKTDHWMSVDLLTGVTLQMSDRHVEYGCPSRVRKNDSFTYDPLKLAFIGLGYTRYNLLFRDSFTGIPKLNITYNTFASHVEPALQTIDLHHIATTQPSVLTFEGMRLLWSLQLSSPVIGLYTVCWQSGNNSPLDCQFAPSSIPVSDKQSSPNDGPDHSSTSTERILSSTVFSSSLPSGAEFEGAAVARLPCVLRKIAFTTYALDMNSKSYLPPHLNTLRLEAKFNGKLDLALSLLVNHSGSVPLYAIPCVAEASLPLRGVRRAPGRLLLEGPTGAEESPCDYTDPICLSRVLVGLYELPPTQLSRWSSVDFVPLWVRASRLRQITDQTTRYGVIIPPFKPVDPNNFGSVKAIGGPAVSSLSVKWNFMQFLTSTSLTVTAATLIVWFFAGNRIRGMLPSLKQTLVFWRNKPLSAPDYNFTSLPPSFDVPDSEGWAGCTASEAGQPEAIRFNVNQVLGCGANGTMVFAGTFGKHQTAVKRIVRQTQLEKHWRREHDILLRHLHPNLVMCFWTGSTANFHYLIMQRCLASLAEVYRSHKPDALSQWDLTPTQVMHQISLAIACLHRNKIVHRDLKPSNVLIVSASSGHRVVVGDFGLSRPLDVRCCEITNLLGPSVWSEFGRSATHQPTQHKDASSVNSHPPFNHGISVDYCKPDVPPHTSTDNTACDQASIGITYGTLGWMAPELCTPNQSSLTYAADIFSFGLLAYFLFTCGNHPFDPDQSYCSSGSDASVKYDYARGCFNSADSSSPSNQLNEVGTISGPSLVCLSLHHTRQLSIVENRKPSLHHLTEDQSDLSTGFLVRQLIQSMLSPDPILRPTAEEISANPLFWSPRKTMLFIAELSDLLDIRKDDPSGQLVSSNTPMKCAALEDRFIAQRTALLRDIEHFGQLVFNKHWFQRLEPDIVQDLLLTRGYQDTSLMDLLRAIRNKRNHIWHLSEHIRDVLGRTQEGMARYWTSRFPALVPLLYGASRYHLSEFSVMLEFLPPKEAGRIPNLYEVINNWWYVPSLDGAFDTASVTGNCNQDMQDDNQEDSLQLRCTQIRKPLYTQWKRGGVIPNLAADGRSLPSYGFAENDSFPDSLNLENSKAHRRQNRAKRVRPPKRRYRTEGADSVTSFSTVPSPGDVL